LTTKRGVLIVTTLRRFLRVLGKRYFSGSEENPDIQRIDSREEIPGLAIQYLYRPIEWAQQDLAMDSGALKGKCPRLRTTFANLVEVIPRGRSNRHEVL